MKHALATYLFEVPPVHDARLAHVLDGLGWKPRLPAPLTPAQYAQAQDQGYDEATFDRLDDFVHFLSMVVLPREPDDSDPRAWLLVEVCADGGEDLLPQRLTAAMSQEWDVIFDALGQPEMNDAAKVVFLRRHNVKMGTTLLDSLTGRPGLCFVGTPGISVRRIRQEAELASSVRQFMRDGVPAGSALTKLAYARRKVFDDPDLKWALVSEPVPLLAPKEPATAVGRIGPLVLAAFRDYLWVLLVLPLVWTVCEWVLVRRDLLGAIGRGMLVLGAELALLGLVTAYAYRRLRQEEEADDPLDAEAPPDAMARLMALENFRNVAQNHLSAQSRLKPGWVRYWTLCLALWVIAEVTRLFSAPGFLNKIGSIHFARWYLLPGTNRLIFLSNYDGSWQSYLEDFIARLRQGLSSIWSNTEDFPRTQYLTKGGAGDGTRFKRWARRQQLPTPVWHTAYPGLTAASIRTHAAIRHGLAGANTEAAAADWLSRLGYSVADEMNNDQVPTLVFGGLPKLRFAHAMVIRLGSRENAKAWLSDHVNEVSYGSQVGATQAVVLGFTFQGLEKLGMPDTARSGFPAAFCQGMAETNRARLLGDFDADPELGPQPPRWGMAGETVDALCLAYAADAGALKTLVTSLHARVERHRHDLVYDRPLAELQALAENRRDVFGFRDGISQPIVRGTKEWASEKQAIHVVNPGEIVLGYRDNLNRIAPTPHDGDVDYGIDGTFLVVRQLAQDVDAFNDFVKTQATCLNQRDGPRSQYQPVDPVTRRTEREEWVAAKMLGRWSDGTPLVRWPERPPWLDTSAGGAPAGGPSKPANDFLLGKEDPDGMRCPFGAHVRRANPRDSLDPGSKTQLAISNRHRILRVGRPIDAWKGEQPGMMFMCLNADIERQFEFLQQTWLLGPNFHGLDNESDPLLGAGGVDQALTVPHGGGTVRLEPISRFVRTMGGGYFFLPGKACLEKLAVAQP